MDNNYIEDKPDRCPHCDAMLPKNMVQCPKCGERVTFAGVKTSKGKGVAILISVLVVACFAFAVLALIGVFKGTPVESYLAELESSSSESVSSSLIE